MSYYSIKSVLSGLTLDIEGQGGSGTKVIPWDHHGGDNQIWFDDPATGCIRSKFNNCALTIENDQLIIKDVQPGNANQQWMRQGNVIRNRTNNKVLDVLGENTAKGAKIGAYDHNGGKNQQWTFEMTGGQAPNVGASAYYQGTKKEFYVASEMHGKVLDICEEKIEAGGKIIMYEKHTPKRTNQLWYLDGQALLRSSFNDLTISNAAKGKQLVTAVVSGDPRSQWQFQGNKIVNKLGEVLDIAQENDDNGAEVISYDSGNGVNQKWRQEFV